MTNNESGEDKGFREADRHRTRRRLVVWRELGDPGRYVSSLSPFLEDAKVLSHQAASTSEQVQDARPKHLLNAFRTKTENNCNVHPLLNRTQHHIHTLENYSAIKRSKLPHLAVWMNLKNMMQSERNQTPETTHRMISLIWNVQIRQIYRQEIG